MARSVGEGAVTQGISMLGGIGQANRQYHRQKKLNTQQYDLQRMLNQQGHDLQMDMWNKTNYKAQMEHMKAAGLNPALMYGSAGAPGTTGSQGGGSAQGGSAAKETVMDMSNMMIGKQMQEADSRIDLNEDLGFKAVEEGKAIGEKLPGEVRKLEEEANNIVASTVELGSRNILNIANKGLIDANVKLIGKQQEKVEAEILKIVKDKELVTKMIEMDYSEEYGKNYMLNLTKMLNLTPGNDGGLGLDDYGKLAVAAGSLTVIRSRVAIAKGTGWLTKKITQGIEFIKRRLRGKY